MAKSKWQMAKAGLLGLGLWLCGWGALGQPASQIPITPYTAGLLMAINANAARAKLEIGGLSVRSFGAKGDTIKTLASITNGQTSLWISNTVSAADLGKMVQVFSADTAVDFVSYVASVSPPHNLTVSNTPTWSRTNADCTLGTVDTVAVQAAFNALENVGGSIFFPKGTYLLYPTNWADGSNLVTYSLLLPTNANVRVYGEGAGLSTLLANGAWKLLSGNSAGWRGQRGDLFGLVGKFNRTTFEFCDLTLDGGVPHAYNTLGGFPIDETTGQGWDLFHKITAGDACAGTWNTYAANGAGELYALKEWRMARCVMHGWRGEMLYGITASHVDLENCVFYDGRASAINTGSRESVSHCEFRDLAMCTEHDQTIAEANCVYSYNYVSNASIALNLCTTNHETHHDLFIGNKLVSGPKEIGIGASAAKHVRVTGNRFEGFQEGIYIGQSGYQGTDRDWDWSIVDNEFMTNWVAVAIHDFDVAGKRDITMARNRWWGTGGGSAFLYCDGLTTNVTLSGNEAVGRASDNAQASYGTSGNGWFPLDRGDNTFMEVAHASEAATPIFGYPISYAYGVRHALAVHGTGFAWPIADGLIPDGARLILRAVGGYPNIYPSVVLSTNNIAVKNDTRVIRPGDTLTLQRLQGKWVEEAYGPASWMNASSPPSGDGNPSTWWYVGETVQNTNTAATNCVGWVCTVAGAPGTWAALTPKGTSMTLQTRGKAPTPAELGANNGATWVSNHFLYYSYTVDGSASNAAVKLAP